MGILLYTSAMLVIFSEHTTMIYAKHRYPTPWGEGAHRHKPYILTPRGEWAHCHRPSTNVFRATVEFKVCCRFR